MTLRNPQPTGFGYPASLDSVFATTTLVAGANQAKYYRVRDGGPVSSILLLVGIQSGNICAGVYRNSGSGRSSVPGTLIATTGSVACPATGDATIALDVTVYVNPGDWLALVADNAVCSFASGASGATATILGNGRAMQQASAFPLPTTPSSLVGLKASAWLIIGG